MKSSEAVARRVTTAMAVAALVLCLIAIGPAQADPSWTRMRTSDFPRRVAAIEFPSSLDAGRCLGWGAWSVCFPDQAPIAYAGSATYPQQGISITIKPLMCKNAAVGSAPCYMVFYYFSKPAHFLACNVWFEENRFDKIAIRCPESLRLK